MSPERGLLDTSVIIGYDGIQSDRLPSEVAISSLTLAELTIGPLAAADELERASRQDLLQRIEGSIEPLPFDSNCARAFGRVSVATVAAGRRAGGSRIVDLLIASTALAHQLPLYTLNASDLCGLEDLIEIVDLT